MFSLTQTLLIGAALLVITASVPAPRKQGVALGWLVALAMLGLGSLAVHGFVSNSGYVVDARPSERAKYVRQALPKLKAKNVIWLDGGSYPTNAVQTEVVERELAKLGYDAQVINMAMGAANHFERQTMYRRLALDFEQQRRPKGQRWVYLAEVQRNYDEQPLAQFEANLESARAYDYLTPRVVWDAFWVLGDADIREHPKPWNLRLQLLRHGLVYAFNAGLASRVVATRKIKALRGDSPRKTPKQFRYPGLAKVIAQAKRPDKVKIPEWLFEVREPRELDIWGEHIKKWLYFAVPSTHPAAVNHASSFCAATKRPCIKPDVELLEKLDGRDKWFNKGHMSADGGKIYSKWLAKKLHNSGALAH